MLVNHNIIIGYSIHWYDTHKGVWLNTSTTTCSGGYLKEKIPSFSMDIAVIFTKQ